MIDEEDDQNFITIRSLIDEGKASPLKVSDRKINIFSVKSEVISTNGDEKQTGISQFPSQNPSPSLPKEIDQITQHCQLLDQ